MIIKIEVVLRSTGVFGPVSYGIQNSVQVKY